MTFLVCLEFICASGKFCWYTRGNNLLHSLSSLSFILSYIVYLVLSFLSYNNLVTSLSIRWHSFENRTVTCVNTLEILHRDNIQT
jgi:hypothetical protein